MRVTKAFVSLFVVLCFAVPSLAQKRLTASDAAVHVGETATVCGSVASTHYSTRTKGQPTFLNLDEPYPKQIFTILIWGDDRSKFGTPEIQYANKKVCVTGLIKMYRGVPEVVVDRVSQIEVQK
jgi:micrococcal nuclease